MVEQAVPPKKPAKGPSLAKASGSMAIATLVSRITGLLAKMMIAWVITLGGISSAYTVANTLPTMVNELLLGGVLTSIAVPLLVRSQKDDPDGGESYTQWMITMSTVVLVIGTVLAVIAAPLLTSLQLDADTKVSPELTTAFAYLILPSILFYGLSALLGAVLNARQVFGAPQWAPVLNNVVVILTLLVYTVTPGEISLDPVRMGEPKLLVLGIGTALGIVVQAVVMLPPLLRTGFRFRWRWGWDRRLSEFGGMAVWVLLYVIVGQVGVVMVTNVASQGSENTIITYNYAWLLLQVPYGVLGVSLLTALLPRMSRASAEGNTAEVVADLSLGNRMSAVLLMPVSALMTVAGPAIAIAFFSLGNSSVSDAQQLGTALGLSAFGLVPYAMTMLQLRVFYAMKDSRTPTIINAMMVVVKVAASYFFLAVSIDEPEKLVVGVAIANSLSFVAGAVIGQVWLRFRLGRLGTGRTLWTLSLSIVASVIGCLVATTLSRLAVNAFAADSPVGAAWIQLVIDGVVVLAVSFGALAMFRAPELRPAVNKISGLLRRR
ncbi:putative peptidoglycan lipid II flippase [Goodfellowiella coeruleoviolacea]|uniref:Peptidoglycan lipid II flippase n=1 Tax=Goodfellowiella coeruleoviolacea TaxID=334858 RepID=A0AAE3KI65_9PSEU|nr:putative peptidoglycan lipid II flippase [Goodfellowiella coeruleoviolacea]